MKDRRGKIEFSGSGYQWEWSEQKERVNKGEYGGCIL
jgi:hypothetical protein